MRFHLLALAIAVAAAGNGSAAAGGPKKPRPPKAQPGQADLGTALQATEPLDQIRLQTEAAYAAEMMPHLNTLKRYSGGSPEWAHWLDMMRMLAFIGQQQPQDALAVGLRLTASRPEWPDAYPMALLAALRAGRSASAVDILERASGQPPKTRARIAKLLPPRLAPAILARLTAAGDEDNARRARTALEAIGWKGAKGS